MTCTKEKECIFEGERLCSEEYRLASGVKIKRNGEMSNGHCFVAKHVQKIWTCPKCKKASEEREFKHEDISP